MSRRRDSYHHGDLRNALISSAVRLIEQCGEASFSLREAARDVGVSTNAAYRHFEDKSALLTAVAAGGLEQMATRMLEAMDLATEGRNRERPTIARFKATGRAYVEFALAHPQLYRVMFSGSGVAHLHLAAATLAIPTPYQLLSRALDALAADGLLPAERRPGAELKAWSVVHGFATLALSGHGHIPVDRQRHEALESMLEFTTLGLCSPPLPRRTPKAR
jgi:AcrR family transcriptional regulator